MAPGNISKKSRRPPAANVRAKVVEEVARMEKEEREEDKKKIEEYQKLLQQKDEELDALTNDQLQNMGFEAMDIDTEGDEAKNGQQDGERGVENVEDMQERKEAEEVNDGENKSVGPDDALPSVESNQGDGNGQNLFVRDSDSDSAVYSDPEHGKPLYSRPGPKSIKDAQTVGWAQPKGISTLYINQYGKKSAARYRLEKYAESAEYEDDPPTDHNVSNSKNRLGDEKLDSGKFKYTKRHVIGIFGVAWKSPGSGKHREDDLDTINPQFVTNWREIPTYVMIAWDIGEGKVKKCWEPRSNLRARWGTKEADAAIYEAAVEAEERYVEAETGKRRAFSKSPSVGLVNHHVQSMREKSIGLGHPSSSRLATSAGKARPSETPTRTTAPIGPAKSDNLGIEFLTGWLEMLEFPGFRNLDPGDQSRCVEAWREEKKKAAYIEAAA